MSDAKSALVTGSTSGIGQSIAAALARAGYHVMLNGMGQADQIEADRAALAKDTGMTVLFDGADMTKPDEIAAMIDRAEVAFGGVDIVVNNAGIQHVAPVETFPLDMWDAIIAINMSSAFHTIRAALPGMKTRGWGRIVNIASAHGLVASPYKSAYVTAKHGLVGLTKTVALEAGSFGVTCNAVCPGYVLTDLVKKQIPDTAKARGISEEDVIRDVLLVNHATDAFVGMDELSALVVFLCSDAAASITGTAMPIDCGWTAT